MVCLLLKITFFLPRLVAGKFSSIATNHSGQAERFQAVWRNAKEEALSLADWWSVACKPSFPAVKVLIIRVIKNWMMYICPLYTLNHLQKFRSFGNCRTLKYKMQNLCSPLPPQKKNYIFLPSHDVCRAMIN